MPKPAFDEVWKRIECHQGEDFRTKDRLLLRYEVHRDGVYPDRTEIRIGRRQFERAYEQMPVDGPSGIKRVTGPSYVWAILHDDRITQGQW